ERLRDSPSQVSPSPPLPAGTGTAGAASAGLSDAAGGGAGARAPPAGAPAGAAVAAPGAAAGRAVAVASPPLASTPISVPTRTVVPSGTRICWSVPSAGDGISTLILSVWISTSGSSLRTRSPTALSHFDTVPSATLSPSWGTTIETDMRLPPRPGSPRLRGGNQCYKPAG